MGNVKEEEEALNKESTEEGKGINSAQLEDVWRLVGGFGRYPALLAIFNCYITIIVCLQQFVQTYYGSAPNFQCVPSVGNSSASTWGQSSWCPINKCGCANCTQYVFDENEFTSAVSEWNLICDRAHLKAMTQSVYMAGLLVGSVVFGKISDHFGRKLTIFLSLFLMVVFGFGSAFANTLTLFAVMRFFCGMATAGCLLVRFVYSMEITNLANRTAMGIMMNLFIVLGALTLTLIAYLVRDFRYLMLSCVLPGIPPLLLWKWIPETPPWLIAKGKLPEAQRVFESYAKLSGVKVDSDHLAGTILAVKKTQSSLTGKTGPPSIIALVKTLKLRKRNLILAYNWFVNSVVFYGITLNARNLGGSLHLNVFILFVVGLPALLTLWVVLGRCGRRVGYCSYMMLGGLACLLVLAVPGETGDHPAIKALAVCGDFFILATFSSVYIYTTELNPTLLRNLSLGVGSMMSRVGGIIAPYIVFLNDFMQNLPLVVFGVMAFSAGLIALMLPETLYSPMPQTVEQAETWAEDYKLPCARFHQRKAEEVIIDDEFPNEKTSNGHNDSSDENTVGMTESTL